MSFTAEWQRWWPLLAAVCVTAIALPGSGVLNGTPTVIVVAVGVAVAAALWGFIELLAQQWRKGDGKPLVVYPAHRAAAGPPAWLLTTPDADGWLGGWLALTTLLFAAQAWLPNVVLPVVLGLVALALLLMLLVVSVVPAAIVWVRRPILGFLGIFPFVVLLVLTDRLAGWPGISSLSAQTWLVYGDGLLVVAGAIWWWWCRTHPRSVDPRSENRSA